MHKPNRINGKKFRSITINHKLLPKNTIETSAKAIVKTILFREILVIELIRTAAIKGMKQAE